MEAKAPAKCAKKQKKKEEICKRLEDVEICD